MLAIRRMLILRSGRPISRAIPNAAAVLGRIVSFCISAAVHASMFEQGVCTIIVVYDQPVFTAILFLN